MRSVFVEKQAPIVSVWQLELPCRAIDLVDADGLKIRHRKKNV
jgi:hypothetical protein